MASSGVERAVDPKSGAAEFEPLPRSSLRGFERIAVPIGERLNTQPGLKALAAGFGYYVPRPFVGWASRCRLRMIDEHNMSELAPKRGVILVSNHRSFFDMYVAASSIFDRGSFIDRLYFPVRSAFFYDHPAGALVNFVMSGYAMWPPMFRDERKGELNPIGLRQMAYALSTPGGVLGIHPEGTRQKGDDPYVLGAARPGVGHLIEQCHPETLVLPFFILGLGNDFLREVSLRLGPEPRPEIRIHWAPALACGELRASHTSPQAIAEHLLDVVHDLGQRDRRLVAGAPAVS